MGKGTLLSVVLVALVVAGGFNYHRNWTAEQEEAPRPYESYADADIAALIEAYEGEVEQGQARYDAARAQSAAPGRGRLLGEQVRDFERAQSRGRHVRELSADLAQREAMLHELRREQELRAAAARGLTTHLVRLLTL